MSMKDIVAALSFLGKANPEDVKAVAADLELDKAAQNLTAAEHVKDRWQEGQMTSSITKEEVKTGPSQSSSGGGAEKMIREYSNPAQQSGTMLTVEALASLLAPIAASSKAVVAAVEMQGTQIGAMLSGVAALVESTKASRDAIKNAATITVKADDKDKDDDEDDKKDDAPAFSTKAGKAANKKARALAAQIDVLKADLEDEDDKTARKALRVQIAAAKSELSKLLITARTHAYAAGSDDLKKAVRMIAQKAEIDLSKADDSDDEDDKDKDDAEKAKKAVDATADAAEKAKTNDKGNQADEKNPANGNQADHAAKAAGDDRLAKALEGLGTIEMSIRQMMDVVAGKSRISTSVPDLAKATPEIVKSIGDRINEAELKGSLEPHEIIAAQDIANRLDAAKNGKLDMVHVVDRIAKASTGVRQIFAGAFTPAQTAAAA